MGSFATLLWIKYEVVSEEELMLNIHPFCGPEPNRQVSRDYWEVY
jgi:hypothetical protein